MKLLPMQATTLITTLATLGFSARAVINLLNISQEYYIYEKEGKLINIRQDGIVIWSGKMPE